MANHERTVTAALLVLIVLHVTMLGALFAAVPPHPPLATPLFGIAPFVGAVIAVAGAAVVLGPLESTAGRRLSLLATLLALVSFGPQKYLDGQFHLIWPAVLCAQAAVVTILVQAGRSWLEGKKRDGVSSRVRGAA